MSAATFFDAAADSQQTSPRQSVDAPDCAVGAAAHRTPTVDLAAFLHRLGEDIEAEDAIVNPSISQAANRLLELHRLVDAALPAVELFGDVATLKSIKQELGL